MLFNRFLASIRILYDSSFLFLVIFNSFFTIPVDRENEKLKISLAIHTGAPVMLSKDVIDTP